MAGKLLVAGSVAYDCIETPLASEDYILGGSASYAALAASYFSPAMMCGIVGNDFKKSDVERLKARSIDISNVVFHPSKPTFFWRGKYFENFNSRETLDVRLNAYEDYKPELNESARSAEYVLLGNISPTIQASVFGMLDSPKFTVADTMDLWINNEREALVDLVRRVDLLILNDSEAKLFTGENNIIRAGRALLKLGAKCALVKAGEYGSMLFHERGFFVAPAYPVDDLRDPTGAGDSFAGALAGRIAAIGDFGFESLKKAMLYASATASMTVESFSCYKLEENGMDEIERRKNYIEKISRAD